MQPPCSLRSLPIGEVVERVLFSCLTLSETGRQQFATVAEQLCNNWVVLSHWSPGGRSCLCAPLRERVSANDGAQKPEKANDFARSPLWSRAISA